jgi:predicted DNA binding protein
MAANKALTAIQHDDKHFNPGDTVTGLSKEVMDNLRAAGAVGEEPEVVEEQEDKEKVRLAEENAKLKAELESVKAELAEAKKTPATPASNNK